MLRVCFLFPLSHGSVAVNGSMWPQTVGMGSFLPDSMGSRGPGQPAGSPPAALGKADSRTAAVLLHGLPEERIPEWFLPLSSLASGLPL